MLLLLLCVPAFGQVRSGVIAFTHAPDGGPPWPVEDVYTIHVDSSGFERLTSDGRSHHPTWSPDGKRLLFIHDPEPGTRPTELSVMDRDGGNRRVLRVIAPVIYSAAWSPNAQTLAISALTGEPPRAGLFVLPANGKGELRLLIVDAWTPSWSPDGKKIAFTLEHPRGHWSIHVAKIDGTGDVRLTDEGVDSGSPAWSPDGKRIAFDKFTGVEGRQQVFVMNADGSNVRPITTSTAWSCEHPAWSPDGTELAVACRSAAVPCGRGIYSNGQLMPECTRRLFVVRLVAAEDAKPVMLVDHDGSIPSFAPR